MTGDPASLPAEGEPPAVPGSVAEHDARRCAACGAPWPSFGFGPPLTRRTVWACGAHRAAVGRAPVPGGAVEGRLDIDRRKDG